MLSPAGVYSLHTNKSVGFSADDHNRALCHRHSSLAFFMNLCQQLSEENPLCFRVVVLHGLEANFFCGEEVTLHERRVHCGRERIRLEVDLLESGVFEV